MSVGFAETFVRRIDFYKKRSTWFYITITIVIGLMAAMPSAYAENIATPASQIASISVQPSGVRLSALLIGAERVYDPLEDPLTVPANDEPFTVRLTKEEIERRKPANAGEAIRYMSPNLIFTRQNRKYRHFYNFRGKSTSLVLDGLPIQDGNANNSTRGDDRVLDLLDTNQIESIELIKDSSAMIYGTLRGGLVHVRTRDPEPGEHGEFSFSYGSFGTEDVKLHFSNRWSDDNAFVMSYNKYETRGPAGKNADEQRQNLALKWLHNFSSKDRLELSARHLTGAFGIPIDENTRGQVPDEYFYKTISIVKDKKDGWRYDNWTDTTLDLKYQYAWTPKQRTDLQLSRVHVTNDFHNPRRVGPNPIGHIDGHHVIETTTTYALRHISEWNNKAITRIGYILDNWENPTGKLYWENRANEDKKHTYYIQGEIPFWNDRWLFDAGYRRDHRYMVREDRFRTPTGKKPAVITDKWEDPRDNYSTGLTWKPTKNDSLGVRFGSIEIAPPERYASASGTALTDETDNLLNIGYEHTFKGLHNMSIDINYFTNKMEDGIVDAGTVPDPNATGTVMRIFKNQTTKVKGSEIALNTGIGKRCDLRLGVGQMDYSPDIPSKPEINYNFSMLYRGNAGITAELYGVYVGEAETTTTLTTGYDEKGKAINKTFPYKTGDYTDMNLSIGKHTINSRGQGRTWRLVVKNLLDKRYETTSASNLFAPDFGRTVMVNFDADF